jgi:hypothetical protein
MSARTRLALLTTTALALCLAAPGLATAAQNTLTVQREGAGTGTVTSSPAAIQCGATCQATFAQGTLVTLTATRGTHSLPARWSGCDNVNAEDRCEATMSAARSVTASFELEPQWVEYPLAIERTGTGEGAVSGPGIECGALCSARFLVGSALALTATPAPGSVFAHWAGGGCTGAFPCTTTVKRATTIKAVFTAIGTRTLSVARNGSGQGTVSAKAAGIECGTACTAQVPAAKKVTLSAKATTGSSFAHWSGACTGTVKLCTVTMSEARQVTATFTGPGAAALASAPCVVPKLTGKSLRAARAALAAAHCALGKVSKPKARNGRAPHPLVVRLFTPEAGASLPAGAKVDLRLGKAKGHTSAG